MSALFKKKKSCVFVFFLLLLADRFSVFAQPFSDAPTVAFEDSPFASNMDELPDGLPNKGSIGFTEHGNLTLTLHKDDNNPVCIPLVALDSLSNFSFRASLGNCNIVGKDEAKWNLSYLGKTGEEEKQVELSIIWDKHNFILANGSCEAVVIAEPKDKAEVDVIFDKSQAFVTEKNVEVTNRTKSLKRIVPVGMQAMANGAFSLSISRHEGSDTDCSITLEFGKDKFGLPKLVVTTTMSTTLSTTPPITDESTIATTPEFDESTMDGQATLAPPGGTNSLWYIIGGIIGGIVLILCLIGIGIGVYFFVKRRRDKSKDAEKNAAVDDSKPVVGVPSFSTTNTTIGTPGTPLTPVDSKADRVPEMKSMDDKSKEPEVKEAAKVVEAVAVDNKSKIEEKVVSKKELQKEDKKKSSKPAKAAEGKPGPKGKKVYVPLIDMDNSLKSKSKQKTPLTDYENYK